jgi:hypothetical protein
MATLNRRMILIRAAWGAAGRSIKWVIDKEYRKGGYLNHEKDNFDGSHLGDGF